MVEMPKAGKLTELVERLKAATGPDRQIDRDIAEHVVGTQFRSTKRGREWLEDSRGGVETWQRHPSPYTASVDACLALVERCLPGCAYRLQRNLDGRIWAELQRRNEGKAFGFDVWCESDFQASTPLAILTALFYALLALDTSNAG